MTDKSLVRLTTLMACALVALAACGGGGDKTESNKAGAEGGPCYGNGTCDPALTCASNTCVRLPGGSGGISGSGGQVQAGGAPQAGAPAGGNGGTPGSGGAALGGASGTGGAGCGDTQTDPANCGACGHHCRGDCAGGLCQPARGACFQPDSGFSTCTAYCGSIGESCSTTGCKGRSIEAWNLSDLGVCMNGGSPDAFFGDGCGTAIDFAKNRWSSARCCCTDTK